MDWPATESTPNFTTPNFTTPNFTTPNFTTDGPTTTVYTPNFTIPNFTSTTDWPATESTPNFTTPNFTTPNFTTPNFTTPNFTTDGPTTTVYTPNFTTPNFTTTTDGPVSTTTVTPATTSQAPLICVNGELQNGVCICPDEWTGDTCDIANFCDETSLGGLTFPKTVIGWYAYSTQKCPEDTENAGVSQASSRCVKRNGNPMFGPVQRVRCGLTLDNIQANITASTDPEEIQELATNTQILTSRPDQLTGSNITAAASIVNTILTDSTNITEDTTVAVVTTVSQLLTVEPEQFTEENDATISVGFVLYENDLFFRSRAFRPSLKMRRMVISGSLGGVTAEHVKLHFLPMNTSDKVLHDFACVFWNYSLNDWSTKGCFKTKTPANVSTLQCQCNHTTNFAVLMSFRLSHQYAKALSAISTVGCSLSILGLLLTIIFQIVTRKSRKIAPTTLLVSICVSMMIFYLLFLFGIENPNQNISQSSEVSEGNTLLTTDLYQEPDRGPCTALTAVMQYFLLATFTWNTLYALHIFVLIRETLSGSPTGFLAASIVAGWGFPGVLVAITVGATYRVDSPLGYRREEFCWLAATTQSGQFDFAKPMFWGFLLPVTIMLLCNTAVLIYFGVNTCKKDPILSSTRNTSLKKLFMSNFSLGAVLGITWVLGYLVLSTTDPTLGNIFSILFCVCNTTQGVQIFILFTVRTADFRRMFQSVTQSALDISLHKQVYELWKARPKGRSENSSSANYQSDGHFANSKTSFRL
ncbi:adhesion G-protein coupled receptor G7-like [Engraulis encrasicolus]|uniref:adhesion G-protein coupled receptor G7-like n=1 Tax=Engraulis encrasicolus TaxID=184585 RepID=UPI002FD4F65C